jgi:serine/threonine protein kinase
MSPEQAAADPTVDGRSDQYSLACVLYEMLAGEPPYAAPTADAMLARESTAEDVAIIKILGEQVKALRELNHQLMDAERSIESEDILNYEGEKLKYYVDWLFSEFRRAMREAKITEIEQDTTFKDFPEQRG